MRFPIFIRILFFLSLLIQAGCSMVVTPALTSLGGQNGVVTAPTKLSYSASSIVATEGVAIPPDKPTSSGGSITKFVISPALPSGFSLNTYTGILSGTAQAVASVAQYTITGSNSAGSVSAVVSLTVNPTPPGYFTYSNNPENCVVNSDCGTNEPSNFGMGYSYTVAPLLPPGLTLNSSGTITGTPTKPYAQANYTVTATAGSTIQNAVISITVVDIPPASISYATNPANFTIGTAISPPESPTVTGGTPTSFTISPTTLPQGLMFNSTTGAISGTPTAEVASKTYTITAINSGGSISIPLPIAVLSNFPPGILYVTGNQAPNLAQCFNYTVTLNNTSGQVMTAPSALSISLSGATNAGVVYSETNCSGTSGNPVPVSMLANTSTLNFSYKPSASGNNSLVATSADSAITSGSIPLTVTVDHDLGAIVFSPITKTQIQKTICSPVQIGFLNQSGTAQTPAVSVPLTVTTSGPGSFHLAADCSDGVLTSFTYPSGYATYNLYYLSSTYGVVTLGAAVNSSTLTLNSATESDPVYAPGPQFVIDPLTSTTFPVNQCSPIKFNLVDKSGAPVTLFNSITVELESFNETLYADSACKTPLPYDGDNASSVATINPGSSSALAYYQTKIAHAFNTIAFRSAGYAIPIAESKLALIVATGATPASLSLWGSTEGMVGSCLGPYYTASVDAIGNVSPVASAKPLQMSVTPATSGVTFYSDPGCQNSLSTFTLNPVFSTPFYFKASTTNAMTMTLQDPSTALASATLAVSFPAAQSAWQSLPSYSGPLGECAPALVWMGNKLLAFWAKSDADGDWDASIYDPSSNTWSTIPNSDLAFYSCPVGGVWTGESVYIFGNGTSALRYVIAANTWFLVPNVYSSYLAAPVNMTSWDGQTLYYFNSGGADSYNPLTATTQSAAYPNNVEITGTVASYAGQATVFGQGGGATYQSSSSTLTFLPTTGAPAATLGAAWLWMGNAFLLWGGISPSTSLPLTTGGLYSPSSGWESVTFSNAPTLFGLNYYWTGSSMIVSGTSDPASANYFDSTWNYNVSTGLFTLLPNTNSPSARTNFGEVWTGGRLIRFGGLNNGSVLVDGAYLVPNLGQ